MRVLPEARAIAWWKAKSSLTAPPPSASAVSIDRSARLIGLRRAGVMRAAASAAA